MKNLYRILSIATALIFLAAASPAAAESPFTNPGDDAAKVIGTIGRAADEIYPVRFIEIDGDNIQARNVMWLKPGKYELAVQATVNNPFGNQLRSRSGQRERGQNRIEVVLEAGKSYFIGLRHNRDDRSVPYTTVLYRVEDGE